MRVLVCGGRHFDDMSLFGATMDDLHRHHAIEVIIHGHATGADTMAHMWAGFKNIAVEPYRADWTKHGRAAGPMRNAIMLNEGKPDLVVAFPGGNGTADMVRRAKAAGVPVTEVTHQ